MTARRDDALEVLDRLIRRLPGQLHIFQLGFAAEIFNEVQSGRRYSPGTPIDTGFARANWDGGPGAVRPRKASVTAAEAKGNPARGRGAAAARAQEVQQAILAAEFGQAIELWNTAPYIRRLEFGWSGQAPKGFVRLTVRHAQHIANDVVQHLSELRAA